MPLYIDAYNLIHAAMHKMDGFGIKNGETEPAREKLLGLLARYRMVKKDRIVVYFDGGREAAHLPRHVMKRGLEVVFSEADSDADSDIKNAVSHNDNPRSIRVVTSDVAIQTFVKRFGARVTESHTFFDELLSTLSDSSLPDDEPIEKYEGSSADETEYWLGVFGEEIEDEEF